MSTGQLDFFSILDRVELPNTPKPWCKSWLCALSNDVGVYVENVHRFRQGEGYRAYVELECALLYPYVYFAISVQDTMGGRGSPLTQDAEWCFTVFDDLDKIDAKVRGELVRCAAPYKVKHSWINDVVKMLLAELQN